MSFKTPLYAKFFVSSATTNDWKNDIREWRQAGGIQHSMHSASQPGHEPGPSPTLSASRKKLKTSHCLASLSLVAPPAMHPRATAASIQPSSTAAKRGAAVGAGSKKPKSVSQNFDQNGQ